VRGEQASGERSLVDLVRPVVNARTPLAWWYRHERGARIYDGPDEVHQASLARRLLAAHGLPPRRSSE